MSRDQKFFDLYSLVIGILAVAALAIFVLVSKMSDLTQEVYTQEGEEYQAAIAERIRPLSQVYLPGDDLEASAPALMAVEEPDPVVTAMTGPQVYNTACLACHGAGVAGAPILGDASGWEARIAQGMDTLNDHAVNGYTGTAGYMPAKGGRVDLSDQEVIDAVAYMVAEAQ